MAFARQLYIFTVSSSLISYNFTGADEVICNGINQNKPNVPGGSFSITYSCSSDGDELTIETSNGVETFKRKK